MSAVARRRRPATRAEAAVLASAVRLRIIRLTFARALTNKEISERLDKDPATTLYHVRKLVDAGFLAALPVRTGVRGAREIPYESTGLSWRLEGAATEDGAAQAMLEAFLGEVAEIGANSLEATRLVLQLDQQAQEELRSRLYALLDEFAARSPQPGQRRTAVYLAVYPSE
ncbi:MAG TPA: winged helix-turn-helix domain-containing protein [Pseudonocardiaceae bacterium]|jgi:DNA-binding transcriptional ArsR family regulator|nr:winged helix-turn-helix domain-containing protein [Pseudonocardiaceae bacterium]